jgi:hypothetical protein
MKSSTEKAALMMGIICSISAMVARRICMATLILDENGFAGAGSFRGFGGEGEYKTFRDG